MKEKTSPQYLMFAAGLAASATVHSYALEATDVLLFNKGPMSLRPQFAATETFNDNILFGDGKRINREFDFITGVTPGFNLLVGENPQNTVKLTYAYDRFLFAEHPDLDADQHRASLSDHFEFHRFTIVGSDHIEYLTSVLGSGFGISENVTRLVNNHDYNIQYAISEKTAVYLEGNLSIVDYKPLPDFELLDSNTMIGTAGFSYLALPKTSLFGEMYYGQTATTPNSEPGKPPHADFLGGFIGAKGDFTAHLTGRVKVGFETRWFSDNGPGASAPVVSASLDERFTEKTDLALNYTRSQQVSVQFSRVSYVIDSADVTFAQIIGGSGRIKGFLQAGYDHIAYDETLANRLDNAFRVGASLNYQIRLWATAGLAYNFEHFTSSSAAVIDYDVNRVTLSLAIGF